MPGCCWTGPGPDDPAHGVLHVIVLQTPAGRGRPGDVAGEEEENHVEIRPEPLVHPAGKKMGLEVSW